VKPFASKGKDSGRDEASLRVLLLNGLLAFSNALHSRNRRLHFRVRCESNGHTWDRGFCLGQIGASIYLAGQNSWVSEVRAFDSEWGVCSYAHPRTISKQGGPFSLSSWVVSPPHIFFASLFATFGKRS